MGGRGSSGARNSGGKTSEASHAKELSWNEEKEYLKNLGYSEREAELMRDVMTVYIQNPNRVQQYEKNIDGLIERMPEYKGEVFRGIVVDEATSYKVGQTIAEGKISSWTSEKSVAREYSGSAEYASQNAWQKGRGQKSVIFVTNDSGGASISRFHSSGNEKYHKEVITKSTAKYSVSKVSRTVESGGREIEYVYLKRKR